MSCVRRSAIAVAAGLVFGLSNLVAQATQPPKVAPVTQAAQTSAGAKVGFVNVGALLKGMPGYAHAESTWTKEADATGTEAQKLRAVFDSAVAQYQQSQAMMTPSNRTAREKALQVQQDSLQKKLQLMGSKVEDRQRELLQPLQERLKAIIDGIRAEGNFALIIDLASEASVNIVSFDKSLDITVKVAQRLAQTN